MKTVFWLAGGVVALVSVVGIALLPVWLMFREDPFPTDEAMIQNFHSHRDEFDRLVAMSKEDRKKYPGIDYTVRHGITNKELSPERRLAYQKCLSSIHTKYGIRSQGDDVYVSFYSEGMMDGPFDDKDFYYSLKRPKPIVSELFRADPNGPAFTRYRHIEDNWYLRYEYQPIR